jgi:isoleucyl-tRNA synthetase
VVTLGLAVRAQNRMKVRIPLQTLLIQKEGELKDELIDILKDELNVKEVKIVDAVTEMENWGISPEGNIRVALDLNLTEELELEGLSREVIRQIQAMRKEAKYERDDAVSVKYSVSEGAAKTGKMFGEWTEEIKKECLLHELDAVGAIAPEEFDAVAELDLSGEKITLGIKK